jgi:hypothetical protein
VHVVDADRRARREDEIARARRGRRGRAPHPADGVGRLDDPQVVLGGLRIQQPRGARVDAQPPHQADQHPLDQLLGRQQVPQLVANFVHQPLLPDQPPVRRHDAAMLDRALHGAEQLLDVERLRHEREGLQLVGRDGRGQRRRPGDDDDLGVGRPLLDRADRVEARLAPERQVHDGEIEGPLLDRPARLGERRHGVRLVLTRLRARREHAQKSEIVFDDK